MTDSDIHIVGILRDSKTKEFRSYTAIPKSKSWEDTQKLINDWNASHKDSTYILSQDKDLIDVVRSIKKEPEVVFLKDEIEELDSVILNLEYERSNLQYMQDKREDRKVDKS